MSIKNEVWKEIPGHEGWYSASNLGRIRRDKVANSTYKGRIKKQSVDKQGYCCVNICKNGIGKTTDVHVLVTKAFLGFKKNKKIEANHKDGNKLNNNITNLEYVSRSENQKHAYRLNLRKAAKAKLTTEQIREIRIKLKNGETQSSIGRQYGVHNTTIWSISKNLIWSGIK